MPQLHLYVPEEVAETAKARARAAGKSLSSYLADLVVLTLRREGEPPALRVPDERFGGGKIRRRRCRRSQTFEGGCDPAEDFAAAVAGQTLLGFAANGLLCCFLSGMRGRTGHIFTDLRLPLAGRGNSGKRCNWANGGYSPRDFAR